MSDGAIELPVDRLPPQIHRLQPADRLQPQTTPTHKLREKLRKNFIGLMRDIREKDNAGILPSGGIKELLLSQHLPPAQRLALVNIIKNRLQLANRLPTQEGLEELSSAYQELLDLEQQRLNQVDLDGFYRDNPAIRVDSSVSLKAGGKRENVAVIYEGNPLTFELETQVADQDNLFFFGSK